ncbi:hypothetical protein CFC21_031251 [Triticum aestivum]|uniref:Uncharacterized protein n=4 Tax=Triticinae TaxID=1648030 RepID=A0A341RF34_WHEAT|nr:hypothetical protein CFC21_031251 [Triticum aestivum]VAH50761.1 unnamed protein product [Triticum turgidum subsp. durum]
MLILELGACIIPMTLIFVPLRRLVLLVAKLQELEECFMRPRPPPPHMSAEMYGHMSTLHTMAIMV